MKNLYVTNYDELDFEIYKLEMSQLFNFPITTKNIVSNIDIDVDASQYFNGKLKILTTGKTIDELVKNVELLDLQSEVFRVDYITQKNDETSFTMRKQMKILVASKIIGKGHIYEYKISYGITKVDQIFYFGEYEKASQSWKIIDKKPHSYSNALPATLSHSLINIATCGDENLKIVDPCCGIGTVVIDGKLRGFNIEGYEINKKICYNAQENLKYFNLDNCIKNLNMHDIEKLYDVSILDIPYGLYSTTSSIEQQQIINTCYKISQKLILVAGEDMSEMVKNSGFNVENCVKLKKFHKTGFTRYIIIGIKQ